MSAKDFLFDLSRLDLNHVIADLEAIRRYNPQRYEMEQLTAIVYEDAQNHHCMGYKQVSHDEFWVRGHMPGMPLMPGVVMCEAAAQLASYYTQKNDLLGSEMVGFGGLEEVRFRDPVVPGDRLYILTKLVKLRRGRMVVCQFQGMVDERIVVEGLIKGVPLPVAALAALRRDAK